MRVINPNLIFYLYKQSILYNSNLYINKHIYRVNMSQNDNTKTTDNEQRNQSQSNNSQQNKVKNQGQSQSQQQKQQKQQKLIEQVEKKIGQLKLTEQTNNQEKDQKESKEQQDDNAKQSQNQLLDETKYFVQISKQNIPFGKNVLFPGSIQQIDVSIGLKDDSMSESDDSDPFMLRVIAKCSNSQFDALDQYVFSVRSNDRFQYFQQVRFRIKKKQRAHVKVAVKIPPVKQNYSLSGVLQVQLQDLKPVCLPITAKCQVPQIICMKDLYKADQQCSMIKVPAKKNQIRMPPIPFKNLSNFNFTLEVEAISNQNFSNRAYDIISQNFVNCQSNMQFFVNLQLKQNINYKGNLPIKDTIRKILILKIKNSSVYFNYPLEINIYESTNSGGMS